MFSIILGCFLFVDPGISNTLRLIRLFVNLLLILDQPLKPASVLIIFFIKRFVEKTKFIQGIFVNDLTPNSRIASNYLQFIWLSSLSFEETHILCPLLGGRRAEISQRLKQIITIGDIIKHFLWDFLLSTSCLLDW